MHPGRLQRGDDLVGLQGALRGALSSFSEPDPPYNNLLPTEDASAATPAQQTCKRNLSSSSFPVFPFTSIQTPRLTCSRVILEQAENQVIFPNGLIGLESGEGVKLKIPKIGKVGHWMAV
jgi:hypothetical protein